MNTAVSLTAVLLLLAPLHISHSRAVALPAVSENNSFTIARPAGFEIRPGEALPLYRFFEQFQSELGTARVEAVDDQSIVARVEPRTLVFQIGRHGVVKSSNSNGLVELDLHGQKLKSGDQLVLFRRQSKLLHTDWFGDFRTPVRDDLTLGKVRLLEDARERQPTKAIVSEGRSELEQLVQTPGALVGLPVSEFTVQTTVVLFSNQSWLVSLEWLAIGAVVFAELALFLTNRKSLLALLTAGVGKLLFHVPEPVRRVMRVLFFGGLSVLLLWYAARFFAVSSWLAAQWLGRNSLSFVASFGRLAVTQFSPQLHVYLFALLALAALVVAQTRRDYLPRFVFRIAKYRPRALESRFTEDAPTQQTLVWILNLIVVYAFAVALLTFISSDVNQALEIVIAEKSKLQIVQMSIFKPATVPAFLFATGNNLSQLFRVGFAPLSADQAFNATRLMIWAITIGGCLIGYAHSVVMIGPWSKIRNVDFTIMGWTANAICYPPLLGAILWSSVPYPYGAVPMVAQGPVFLLLMTLDLTLNVLYMASVWNLGTKFGVMVDKGLVTTGFYSLVRHPSYFLEAIMLALIGLKTATGLYPVLGSSFNFFTYWLRSERDESFMLASNPDYAEYRNQVPFKYIRDVW